MRNCLLHKDLPFPLDRQAACEYRLTALNWLRAGFASGVQDSFRQGTAGGGESSMPIGSDALQLDELVLGVRFHAEITLTSDLAEKYYRTMTRVRSGLFTSKIVQPGAPLVLLHESLGTQCLVTTNSLEFRESKHLDQESFAKISHSLVTKLVEIFEMNDDNFRLFGKIYRYRLRLPNVLETFKKSVGMFANDDVRYLHLRTAIREGGKNVHFNFQTAEKEGKPVKDEILFSCDINNADQDSYQTVKILDEIVAFADKYNKQCLLDVLNAKLQVE